MPSDRNRVCQVDFAKPLTSKVRRWLQDPLKILSPLVRDGMTVLDVGCGPGFFSVAMAEMVGPSGRVISADLQDGMLQKLRDQIHGTPLEARIQLVKCESDRINVTEKVDFALAFWMVHEVPDQASFFAQLKAVLKENGQALLVEPKLFHVSRGEFDATKALAEGAGFVVREAPRLSLCWSAIISMPQCSRTNAGALASASEAGA